MENSANQENAKPQQAEDQQHNIETVTPDLENVHPLSRQESKEGSKAADEPSASGEENTSTTAEQNGENDPRDDIETVSP